MEVSGASESLREELELGTSYGLALVVTLTSSLHINTAELIVGLKKSPPLPPWGGREGCVGNG